MKRALRKVKSQCNVYYIDGSGTKIYGLPPHLTGHIGGLTGNIGGLTGHINKDLVGEINRDLTGNIGGLTGEINKDLTGEINKDLVGHINRDLTGNIGGLTGEISGLVGNIGECEIADEDRAAGIDVMVLIKED